jgi:uncharacterized protein (DUF1330 family)
MKKGYLILSVAIIDAALYDEYRVLAKPSLERFGGKIIVRSDQVDVLEGECRPPLLVIVEFPSLGRAREHYESTEYRNAIGKRLQAATCKALLVEGTGSSIDPAPPRLLDS